MLVVITIRHRITYCLAVSLHIYMKLLLLNFNTNFTHGERHGAIFHMVYHHLCLELLLYNNKEQVCTYIWRKDTPTSENQGLVKSPGQLSPLPSRFISFLGPVTLTAVIPSWKRGRQLKRQKAYKSIQGWSLWSKKSCYDEFEAFWKQILTPFGARSQ